MKKFNIDVIVPPPQSPDLNVDDMAFFNSLQSDVSIASKETRRELEAVVNVCEKYPLEKMESVWLSLYASVKGVMDCGGDNDYLRHRRIHRDHAAGINITRLSRKAINDAEKMLCNMKERERENVFCDSTTVKGVV